LVPFGQELRHRLRTLHFAGKVFLDTHVNEFVSIDFFAVAAGKFPRNCLTSIGDLGGPDHE